MSETPLRPLLPPQRKAWTVVAEYVGTIMIPVFFVGLVVGLSALLLMMVFRSVAIAAKAAATRKKS